MCVLIRLKRNMLDSRPISISMRSIDEEVALEGVFKFCRSQIK
jgi:hypothetical protein